MEWPGGSEQNGAVGSPGKRRVAGRYTLHRVADVHVDARRFQVPGPVIVAMLRERSMLLALIAVRVCSRVAKANVRTCECRQ